MFADVKVVGHTIFELYKTYEGNVQSISHFENSGIEENPYLFQTILSEENVYVL